MVSLSVLSHDVQRGHERALAASPVLSQGSELNASTFHILPRYTTVDDYPVAVFLISPDHENAPLPPGIHAWPQPGQSYVSPQLASELTQERAEYFGHIVGQIDRDALESPNERRVYFRPSPHAAITESMIPAQSFVTIDGDEGAVFGVGELNRAPLKYSVAVVILCLLLPGLLTIAIGVSSGRDRTRHIFRMLATMGLTRAYFIRLDMIEHLPAALLGALIVACGSLVSMKRDVTLHFLDARYNSGDIRAIAPTVVLAILAGLLISLATVHIVRTAIRGRVFRTRQPVSRIVVGHSLISSLAIFLLVAAAVLPLYAGNTPFRGPFVTLVGLIEPFLLWAPVAIVCTWVASLVMRIAHRNGSPSALVSARLLERGTTSHVSIVVGVCAVILTFGLLHLNTSSLTGQMSLAQQDSEHYGLSVLRVSLPPAQLADEDIERALPDTTLVVGISNVLVNNIMTTEIQGDCESLAALGFSCPTPGDEEVQYVNNDLARYVTKTNGDVVVAGGSPWGIEDPTVMLFSRDGSDLNRASIQTALWRYVPGATVDNASSWYASAFLVLRQAWWVMFLSAFGAAGLMYALCVAVIISVRVQSMTMAPLSATTGAPHVSATATAVAVSLPLFIAGVMSTGVYCLLPIGMRMVTNDPDLPNWKVSPVMVVGCLVLTTLAAVFSAWSTYRTSRRDCRLWHP